MENINNSVVLAGEIASELKFSHESYREKFYSFELKIERISGNEDYIPMLVSDRLMDLSLLTQGTYVFVEGQIRTYNIHENEKNRLIINVFVKDIDVVEVSCSNNVVEVDGFICKQPIYRKTPLGREITDLLLAVHRPYGKSDYIPCIVWGRDSRYASTFNVGDEIKVSGRIQCRQYTKRINEDEVETRMAYEVSASQVDLINEGGEKKSAECEE